jgi:hypothetical protein
MVKQYSWEFSGAASDMVKQYSWEFSGAASDMVKQSLTSSTLQCQAGKTEETGRGRR